MYKISRFVFRVKDRKFGSYCSRALCIHPLALFYLNFYLFLYFAGHGGIDSSFVCLISNRFESTILVHIPFQCVPVSLVHVSWRDFIVLRNCGEKIRLMGNWGEIGLWRFFLEGITTYCSLFIRSINHTLYPLPYFLNHWTRVQTGKIKHLTLKIEPGAPSVGWTRSDEHWSFP